MALTTGGCAWVTSSRRKAAAYDGPSGDLYGWAAVLRNSLLVVAAPGYQRWYNPCDLAWLSGASPVAGANCLQGLVYVTAYCPTPYCSAARTPCGDRQVYRCQD